MSQEKIARIAEIQKLVDELIQEGQTLAEETKTMFSLAHTPLSGEYGFGGLVYIPEGLNVDRWGQEIDGDSYSYCGQYTGWCSSSSDEC